MRSLLIMFAAGFTLGSGAMLATTLAAPSHRQWHWRRSARAGPADAPDATLTMLPAAPPPPTPAPAPPAGPARALTARPTTPQPPAPGPQVTCLRCGKAWHPDPGRLDRDPDGALDLAPVIERLQRVHACPAETPPPAGPFPMRGVEQLRTDLAERIANPLAQTARRALAATDDEEATELVDRLDGDARDLLDLIASRRAGYQLDLTGLLARLDAPLPGAGEGAAAEYEAGFDRGRALVAGLLAELDAPSDAPGDNTLVIEPATPAAAASVVAAVEEARR